MTKSPIATNTRDEGIHSATSTTPRHRHCTFTNLTSARKGTELLREERVWEGRRAIRQQRVGTEDDERMDRVLDHKGWQATKGGHYGTTENPPQRSRRLGIIPVETLIFSRMLQSSMHLVKGCAELLFMYPRTQPRTQATRHHAQDGQTVGVRWQTQPQQIDSNSSLIAITSLLISIISYCE